MKLQVQSPGPWSVAVFGGACAVVIAMFVFKVPDAGKVATALVALVGTWLARSAVSKTDGDGEDGES